MSDNVEALITPMQNHLSICHLKVTTKQHEQVLHSVDKSLDRIIMNMELHEKRLDAIEKHQQRQRAKEERAEGARELLRKIWSFKSIAGFLFVVLLTLCTSHNDAVQELLKRYLGW